MSLTLDYVSMPPKSQEISQIQNAEQIRYEHVSRRWRRSSNSQLRISRSRRYAGLRRKMSRIVMMMKSVSVDRSIRANKRIIRPTTRKKRKKNRILTCAFEKKGRKSKMIFLEIVMIVIGLGAIIYSTKITDGAESSDIKSVVDGQDQMEQLRHKIEQFNEEITRKQEEKLEDTSEKMNTISNEKIMGISEYSDQVIDKIEKNHAEVVFLYDMLNEKQAEIQKLIHEADSSKVQFQDELAKSYQNVKDIVDPVEVSGKDAKKTGNEQSDSDLSEEDYDLQKLSDKERQAFDEEFSMQKEEKKVNHNEEILALHDKGYSILEISKMLEMGQGEVKFVLDMYA